MLMNIHSDIPVLGFAAYSGTGKTSLLVKLLPRLNEKGIRVGVIKHAHHTFDIDHEGKDSYELRKAGARQMLIGSDKRWALIAETENNKNRLGDFIEKLDHASLDLILVEGFKPESIPKIELTRPSLGNPLFYPEDKSVIAVATDAELPVKTTLPVLDLNNPDQIVEFILGRFMNQQHIQTGT
jgi:molybdopterin-guanine dinucleotide biosynthesis protein MobB